MLYVQCTLIDVLFHLKGIFASLIAASQYLKRCVVMCLPLELFHRHLVVM